MQLVLEGIGHRFGTRPWLFSNVAAVFKEGDKCAIVGPSGSGKSTLLSIVAGMQEAAAGVVRRIDVHGVSWVAQNPLGSPSRSALDHVVFPLLTQGMRRRDAEPLALETLQRFGLSGVARAQFRHLSGGEAQRLMLARAILVDADLVLVDEPTAQLDPVSTASVIDVLRAMSSQNRIVLVATHDDRVVGACASTLLLRGGR